MKSKGIGIIAEKYKNGEIETKENKELAERIIFSCELISQFQLHTFKDIGYTKTSKRIRELLGDKDVEI